jgi:hypothetical protein
MTIHPPLVRLLDPLGGWVRRVVLHHLEPLQVHKVLKGGMLHMLLSLKYLRPSAIVPTTVKLVPWLKLGGRAGRERWHGRAGPARADAAGASGATWPVRAGRDGATKCSGRRQAWPASERDGTGPSQRWFNRFWVPWVKRRRHFSLRPCLDACVSTSIHVCWSGLEWILV